MSTIRSNAQSFRGYKPQRGETPVQYHSGLQFMQALRMTLEENDNWYLSRWCLHWTTCQCVCTLIESSTAALLTPIFRKLECLMSYCKYLIWWTIMLTMIWFALVTWMMLCVYVSTGGFTSMAVPCNFWKVRERTSHRLLNTFICCIELNSFLDFVLLARSLTGNTIILILVSCLFVCRLRSTWQLYKATVECTANCHHCVSLLTIPRLYWTQRSEPPKLQPFLFICPRQRMEPKSFQVVAQAGTLLSVLSLIAMLKAHT